MFRITTTRRLFNTITEGEYFFPMYMYLTPYVLALRGGHSWNAVNQVVDYMLAANTPLFHQATNFKTRMRISHLQSNVKTVEGATERDTVAGNNTPYLNVGRDTMGIFKNAPCGPTATTYDTEADLRKSELYGVIHNGGCYYKTLGFTGSADEELVDFGTQGPYSLFGEIKTYLPGSSSICQISNQYSAPDGHAFVVPSVKPGLGYYSQDAPPTVNIRFPFPSAQVGPVNDNQTTASTNPPESSEPTLRVTDDISEINLNSGGEAYCFWLNPLDPDSPAGATKTQKLQMSFMMELECDIDVKINYSPRTVAGENPLYFNGVGTGGKTVAMPCQNIVPSTQADGEKSYWIFGDGLRPCHRNNL